MRDGELREAASRAPPQSAECQSRRWATRRAAEVVVAVAVAVVAVVAAAAAAAAADWKVAETSSWVGGVVERTMRRGDGVER
jgi:hypothetical protein